MKTFWKPVTIALLALYTLLMGYFIIGPVFSAPRMPLFLSIASLALFGFSLAHAILTLGSRRALLFFLLAFTVSLLFESVGVLTGWIYGPYHYTERLGVKIFGLVPLLIPIAWFMMIYPSYILVEYLADSRPYRGWWWLIWLSGMSALAMTAWDLVMDPIMVGSAHWVWEVSGAYFGIPIQNYIGWLLTTFVIYLAYRSLTEGQPLTPGQALRPIDPIFALLPVVAYAITWLGNVAIAFQTGWPGAALAGFFAMGSFALLGLGAALRSFSPQPTANSGHEFPAVHRPS
ncbi:MAG: carotenoid biosynthesis protein [Chloroflexi bacterium]|nr:carotenoid biosynthesis protein [Chloroflexota bacterium]